VDTTTLRLQSAASSLHASSSAFSAFLRGLAPERAVLPLPGGWSPAAHVLHVAMTNEAFAAVLAGTVPLTVDDEPSYYGDTDWSFAAPPPAVAPPLIMPDLAVTPEVAAARLAESAAALATAIGFQSPAGLRRRVHLPWGRISFLQMCEWATGHTLRHVSQVGRELQLAAARAQAS
jgi:hypothetical protein